MEDFQLYDITVEKICNEVSVRKNIPALQKEIPICLDLEEKEKKGGERNKCGYKEFSKHPGNVF